MAKIAAVVAAWNEEENIEALTRRIHAALTAHGEPWELIYVIEGTDRTRAIAEELARELGGDIRILFNDRPSGLGAAFRRGFAAISSDTELIVTMDADLNHQPEEIPRLIEVLRETNSDIVVGSRVVAGSTVAGTPTWKRLLSWTLNLIMRVLFGIPVHDKTSGFRVYRADVVRAMRYRNDQFAFLPEIIIRAHKERLKITEAPIHFIFRREGQSKMKFWPTSLSYLTLLRTRFDLLSLAAIALVFLGFGVRIAASYPVHKYPADADALLNGICACRVLDGDVKVFLSRASHGALECYVTAVLFALFGVSRATLAFVTPLVSLLTLIVDHRLFRELFDRKIALLALLLFAVPPPAVLFWTYMPTNYATTLLLCVAVLWLAARMARRGPTRGWLFAFGVVCGLALWQTLLTLSCVVPAVLFVVWKRWRSVPIIAAGFVLGALPWIAFNVRYPLGSLRGNPFMAQSAGRIEAVLSNAAYVASYRIPELVAGLDPMGRRHVIPLLVIYLAATVWFFARRSSARPLLAGVATIVMAMNLFSWAGQIRAHNVRYMLPLWIVFVAALAWALFEVGRRSRVVAAVIGAAILVVYVIAYPLPGEPHRRQLEEAAVADAQLAEHLLRTNTKVIVGDYWAVYPFAFLTRERVIPLPCEPWDDFLKMYERVPEGPVRWAFVVKTPTPPYVTITREGTDYFLMGRRTPAAVSATMRVICTPP